MLDYGPNLLKFECALGEIPICLLSLKIKFNWTLCVCKSNAVLARKSQFCSNAAHENE